MAVSLARLNEVQRLEAAGQISRAIDILRREVARSPGDGEASFLLGRLLVAQKNLEGAVYYFQRAAAISPREVLFQATLGEALLLLGRHGPAIDHLWEAARLDPHNVESQRVLMGALEEAGDCDKALALWRASSSELRSSGYLGFGMASLCGAFRRFGQSRAEFEEAVQRAPADFELRQTFAHAALSWDSITGEDLLRVHTSAGTLLQEKNPPDPHPFSMSRDPDRRLRIGYVSQDFRNRSAAHFIEPILRHHDRASFEVLAYDSSCESDHMTQRLRALTSQWRDIGSMSDEQAACLVRADSVDILVDLCGMGGGGRLGMFCRRAAPIQVTYMGYPCTTGVAAIDYRLVDETTDPPGSDPLATERLVRLPGCFLCYAPPGHAPEVAELPASARGHVTFGSFNMLAKLSDSTLDLWCRVLRETPGSRILIKAGTLESPTRERVLRGALAARGIAPERARIRGETRTPGEHMAMYAEMDIALDSIPYNGTTTTLEALWMGVPVVTLEGSTHHARVGSSLLTNAGMPELVAKSHDEFVAIARDLAGEPSRLAERRASLRARIAQGPLCKAPEFARKVEAAYRQFWREWCAG